MKQPTWVPAFAAGALFAGAIALAAVLTQPDGGSIALDRAPAGDHVAVPDRPAVMGRSETATTVEPPTTGQAERSEPATSVPAAPATQSDAAQETAAAGGVSDTTAAVPVEDEPDATSTSVPPPVVAGNADVAHTVEDGCRTKGAEWQRREEAGEIDWDELGQKTYDDDEDSVWLEPTPYDGSVWAPGQRPSLPDFSNGLVVGTLSNRDLLFAVEVCDEAGMFPEG